MTPPWPSETPWPPETALDFGRFQIESHAEFVSNFVAGTDDGVVIIPCLEDAHDTAVMLALAIAAGKLPSVNWLILVSDTYATKTTDPADLPDSIEQAFLAGDPRVHEALAVYCLAPDGPGYIADQHYRRISDTNGLIEWDEPAVSRDLGDMDGPVLVAMGLVLTAPFGGVPGIADGITAVVSDPEPESTP